MQEKLRAAAAQAELRGDWDIVELLNLAADRLISLEAQNVAYRQALTKDVVINFNGIRKIRSIFRHGENSQDDRN